MTRKERIDVRLSPAEAVRARFVARALDRSRADAIRFLLDREYRVLKGFCEPKEAAT